MWRARQKELELNDRLKGRSRDGSSGGNSHRGHDSASPSKRPPINVNDASASCSSIKRVYKSGDSREDEELEKFLHSRVKRGRGGVGPRMDKTGPYRPPCPDSKEELSTSPNVWKRHVVYGPEKPSSLQTYDSSEEEHNKENRKKVPSGSSDKQHSRKHRSKDESMDKKKKSYDEKRNKHHE